MPDKPATTGLDAAFETPEAKARHVRRLFATIADRYDLITRLLSFGLDQRWKRQLIALARVRPGDAALDLACGTGDLALLIAGAGATVTGLDVTDRMLRLARAKRGADAVRWLVGDMVTLPVATRSCDLVTTGYGIRNVHDLDRSLREIHRVLKPGGRLAVLDFNRPDSALVRAVYLGYLAVVGWTLGVALHGDGDTYRYIPASIRRYPGARSVAVMMREAGFARADVIPVLGGLMAIHLAEKGPR